MTWSSSGIRSRRSATGRNTDGFQDAQLLLAGSSDYLEVYDRAHSESEDRFIAIGPMGGTVICVVYTERDEGALRIISARRATRREVVLFQREMGGSQR